MPLTPVHDLPYPAPTGVAPDVPFHMQQLAEAAEAAMESLHPSKFLLQIYSSANTDSQGFRTFSHTAPWTPDAIFLINLTPSTTFAVAWGVDNITGSAFRARFATGSSAADGPLVSLPTGTIAALMVNA